MPIPAIQEISQEDLEESLMESMMFRELMDHKVDVRSTCARCSGTGVVDHEECPVCRGDRKITQALSLYKIAKMIVPVIIREVAKKAQAAQAANEI